GRAARVDRERVQGEEDEQVHRHEQYAGEEVREREGGDHRGGVHGFACPPDHRDGHSDRRAAVDGRAGDRGDRGRGGAAGQGLGWGGGGGRARGMEERRAARGWRGGRGGGGVGGGGGGGGGAGGVALMVLKQGVLHGRGGGRDEFGGVVAH